MGRRGRPFAVQLAPPSSYLHLLPLCEKSRRVRVDFVKLNRFYLLTADWLSARRGSLLAEMFCPVTLLAHGWTRRVWLVKPHVEGLIMPYFCFSSCSVSYGAEGPGDLQRELAPAWTHQRAAEVPCRPHGQPAGGYWHLSCLSASGHIHSPESRQVPVDCVG